MSARLQGLVSLAGKAVSGQMGFCMLSACATCSIAAQKADKQGLTCSRIIVEISVLNSVLLHRETHGVKL